MVVQGRVAASAAGRDDHQHHVDPELSAEPRPARLRVEQSRHHGFYACAGQAGRSQGHSRECGRAGPVWTPLQPSGGQPQEKVEKFGSEVPMRRPGQPAELAPVYVLLASQESSFVTGEVYGVTGGNHLP